MLQTELLAGKFATSLAGSEGVFFQASDRISGSGPKDPFLFEFALTLITPNHTVSLLASELPRQLYSLYCIDDY